MRNLLFLAFIFSITLSLVFPACDPSGGGGSDNNGSDDDTATDGAVDDVGIDGATGNIDADDSAADDDNDDSVGDDGLVVGSLADMGHAPPNVDLWGTVSWGEGEELLWGCYRGATLHFSQSYWEKIDDWECNFKSIWGPSRYNLYAVGVDMGYARPDYLWTLPCMARKIGGQWIFLDPAFLMILSVIYGFEGTLNGVYGSSASDVYIVGGATLPDFRYLIFHNDGYGWTIEKMGSMGSSLSAVWASPTGLAAAVGCDYTGSMIVVTKENGVWNETNFAAQTSQYPSVWGAPEDVIFASVGEDMFRYENGNWGRMNAQMPQGFTVAKLSGASSTDVYALGSYNDEDKTIALFHYEGSSWAEIHIPFSEWFYYEQPGGLWVQAHDSVYISITERDAININHYSTYLPYGQTFYYNGRVWQVLSQEAGPNNLWGFVTP